MKAPRWLRRIGGWLRPTPAGQPEDPAASAAWEAEKPPEWVSLGATDEGSSLDLTVPVGPAPGAPTPAVHVHRPEPWRKPWPAPTWPDPWVNIGHHRRGDTGYLFDLPLQPMSEADMEQFRVSFQDTAGSAKVTVLSDAVKVYPFWFVTWHSMPLGADAATLGRIHTTTATDRLLTVATIRGLAHRHGWARAHGPYGEVLMARRGQDGVVTVETIQEPK